MTPEEIRKQMMGSAGLYEASSSETDATKSNAVAKAVELPSEVESAGPEHELDLFKEDRIASGEIPRPEGSEALQTMKV